MYNYNFCIKKLKESKRKLKKQVVEDNWLRNYHDKVQPNLLEHYDARVNAFIKRVEENPSSNNKIIDNPQASPFKPFKFALSQRSHTEHKLTSKNIDGEDYNKGSIFRSSLYIPMNQHQFRQRDKSKEIKSKSSRNQALYIKMKEQRKAGSKLLPEKAKASGIVTTRKPHKESYSDANSFYDDNISLRYSINSQMENIERQAMEYEKKLEIVQKKSHYKRLANLQVLVSDQRAKKSIYDLLVREGKRRAKIKTEREQGETDMLKFIIQKGLKTENL